MLADSLYRLITAPSAVPSVVGSIKSTRGSVTSPWTEGLSERSSVHSGDPIATAAPPVPTPGLIPRTQSPIRRVRPQTGPGSGGSLGPRPSTSTVGASERDWDGVSEASDFLTPRSPANQTPFASPVPQLDLTPTTNPKLAARADPVAKQQQRARREREVAAIEAQLGRGGKGKGQPSKPRPGTGATRPTTGLSRPGTGPPVRPPPVAENITARSAASSSTATAANSSASSRGSRVSVPAPGPQRSSRLTSRSMFSVQLGLTGRITTVLDQHMTFIQMGGTIDKGYPRSTSGWAFEIGEPAVREILGQLHVPPPFPYSIVTVCKKDSQEITDLVSVRPQAITMIAPHSNITQQGFHKLC